MKVILDLDTGIDDALALAYALAHPNLELIGVTGTYGNVTVEQGVRNTLALLELLGAPEVPVFLGSERPGFRVQPISAFIHGANGLGQAEIPAPRRGPDKGTAVDFLLSSFARYGTDLTVIPTGPSTTIAAAMSTDPAFARQARIIMMGGALTVPGNVSAWAEANVSQDPEASDAVFRQGGNITMVGLDVTLQTLLRANDTARWRRTDTAAGRAYAEMADYYIRAYATTSPHLGGCGLHDPLAVAVAADPSLVTVFDTNLKCDTTGPTRGRTIGDETRLAGPLKTAHVAIEVDAPRFVATFVDTLEEYFQA